MASPTPSPAAVSRLRRHLAEQLKAMPPAYFALAMATGIVSIAGHRLGMQELAVFLLWLNVVAYFGLWALTILRAFVFTQAFWADWTSHQRAPGFFTVVAATCVIGTQFVLVMKAPALGFAFWCIGLVLWALCSYGVLLALTVGESKPTLSEGINGGWLVAAVATQAICVLGCAVVPDHVGDKDAAYLALTAFWLVGGMLYMWVISLIFYRYTFFPLGPDELMPPYWINMGAVAISTLAGTGLIGAAAHSAFLTSMLPALKLLSLAYWATATWWIPLLVALGVWRHHVRRVTLSYDPLYWGLVFPLGMYSVCTGRLADVFHFTALYWLAGFVGVVAVVAWTSTCFGLLGRFVYAAVLATRAAPRPLQPSTAPPSWASIPMQPLRPSEEPHDLP